MLSQELININETMKSLTLRKEEILEEAKKEIIEAVEAYASITNTTVQEALGKIFAILPLKMQEEMPRPRPGYAPCYFDPVSGRLHTLIGGSNWQFQKNLFHSGGSEEALKTFINKDHPKYNNPKWFAEKMEVLRRIYNRAGIVLSVRIG